MPWIWNRHWEGKIMENENILKTTSTPLTKTVGFKKCSETCPSCGDENEFHMILIKDTNVQSPETKFQLKCPSCYQAYNFNLQCEIKC